ncbi:MULTISPECIES: PhzF family phenazine biosynthesis protein [Asaia]|uniref:Phenazine biosynthesis protein PhzF like n=1 Tax=Asaia bogorensis TaxID=91915 RepID=A0A060QK78_9PROT|nr:MULTISPECIES: PhzF family phenazine biosynthesis protein [Asaia]ETC97642.1 phenazine biosynthesis protein PhzF [Asaia sp. SF2.1]CDG41173.1 Phenazine biosynthesis protein PhzF like [Asaia bogorensis]
MSDHPFRQVDVFAATPFAGNPLAVILDADGLDDALMARIANWTNLSETTFLLRPTTPEASYRVRIFTPGGELPFAGHPTLGTAFVWASLPGNTHDGIIVQECGVGLVRVRVDGTRFAFAAPPRRRATPLTIEERNTACAALGLAPDDILDAAWGDNGPPWQLLSLRERKDVLSVRPDWSRMGDNLYGIVAPWQENRDETGAAFEIRAFVGQNQGFEDPVTGSLNAAMAQWMIGKGAAPESYIASQGTAMGRNGRVSIVKNGETIWVGGTVTPRIAGTLTL